MKFLYAISLIIWTILPNRSLAQSWPEIRETEVSVRFSAQYDQFEIKLPIHGEAGEVLYWVYCGGGKDKYLDSFYDRFDINYVGPLFCSLTDFEGPSEATWLSSDGSSIWHSRGQFHYRQLLGACGDYPEFGKVRNFKLRGMLITLEISDVNEVNKTIQDFLLTIKVTKDTTALTAQAEPPNYLNPFITSTAPQPRGCGNILMTDGH